MSLQSNLVKHQANEMSINVPSSTTAVQKYRNIPLRQILYDISVFFSVLTWHVNSGVLLYAQRILLQRVINTAAEAKRSAHFPPTRYYCYHSRPTEWRKSPLARAHARTRPPGRITPSESPPAAQTPQRPRRHIRAFRRSGADLAVLFIYLRVI